MIEQIEIHRFRGIEAGKLKRLRQFNLLVGPNNAGKSAVLEAIYLAVTANQSVGLTITEAQSSENYNVNVSDKDMLYQHPTTHLAKRHKYLAGVNGVNRLEQDVLRVTVADEQLSIGSFELASQLNGVQLTPEESQRLSLFRLSTKSDKKGSEDNDSIRRRELAKLLVGQNLEQEFVDQEFVFCWQKELSRFYKGSSSWWLEGQLPPAKHTLYYDVLSVQEHLPLAFYEEMLSKVPGWTQKIARHFGRIFDLMAPFAVQFLPLKHEPELLQGWIAPEEDTAVSIDAWGDGSRAAFKLLTPLTALAHLATPAMPGILLWEEPEMFQNPQTLGKLLREVADIVRDKPIQIFIVSHSLEVITHLTQMLQEDSLPADDTIAFLLNLERGQLKSTWFETDNLQSWLESGLDPRIWGDFVPPVKSRFTADGEG